VIYIDIFPDLIDVNVHPTKAEIKFKDDRFIYKAVFDTVHESIRKSLRNSFDIDTNTFDSEISSGTPFASHTLVQIPLDLKPETSYEPINNEQNNAYTSEPFLNNSATIASKSYNYSAFPIEQGMVDRQQINENPVSFNNNSLKVPKFQQLSVIGQFNNTYILAQAMEEMYIIDQHAAHEKIIFERYISEVEKRKVVAQILASPIVLELSSEDFAIYFENIEIFKNTGFNIEIFGENTISIREVPIILGETQIRNLFLDILDNIKMMGTGQTSEVKYDKIAKLSCKAAVKANNKLSINEMVSLVEELRHIENPFTCPHGRPTIVKITLNELEKRFKRIQ
jgi:DNA mismatch repair protein MutL